MNELSNLKHFSTLWNDPGIGVCYKLNRDPNVQFIIIYDNGKGTLSWNTQEWTEEERNEAMMILTAYGRSPNLG